MKTKILVGLVVLSFPMSSFATMALQKSFKEAYPNAKSLHSCKACHDGAPPKLNVYGADIAKAGNDIKAVEALDSDGDGFKNLDEITANVSPADKAAFPKAE